MKRLWAPWRMEYIAGEQRPGCLFCRVIADPNDKDAELAVWRPEGALVMLNKFPYNPGHTMVAPEAHVPGLEVLDDAQTTVLMRAVRRTIDVLRDTLNPEDSTSGSTWVEPQEPAFRTTCTFTSCRDGTATRTSCQSSMT